MPTQCSPPLAKADWALAPRTVRVAREKDERRVVALLGAKVDLWHAASLAETTGFEASGTGRRLAYTAIEP